MKKIQFFAAALALAGAAGLASCSNDEPKIDNPSEGEVLGYMTVRLVNTDGSAVSRAGEDFEDGTPEESKINNIAFYFFNENGSAYKMTNNNVTGNVQKTNMVIPTSIENGVATLVLGKENPEATWKGGLPARVVCVANSSKLDSYANISLTDLKNIIENATNTAETGFVMASSTYGSGSAEVSYSAITIDNIGTTPDLARQKPVKIYIERVAAKVEVALGGKFDADGKIKLENLPEIYGEGETPVQNPELYAKITGWALNATADRSFGVKKFPTALNLFDGYNLPEQFRSCWATIPSAATLSKSFKYDDLNNALGSVQYCHENTRQASIAEGTQKAISNASTNATKVLLQARIVDKDGKAVELVKWANTLYTLDAFKLVVAKAMKGGADDVDKVTFVRGKGNVNDEGGKKVSTVKVQYDGDDVDAFSDVRLWNDGVCYYIINIKHATDNAGNAVYGVVRNHVYKLTINSIAGLGTPGGKNNGDNGDPDPTPEPENPDPEDNTFVAVSVNILPWHIVAWDVDVES